MPFRVSLPAMPRDEVEMERYIINDVGVIQS